MNDKVPPWVIFHVPHDSTFIPEEVRDQFVLNDKTLDEEILKMSDLWTHVLLANGVPASQIVASPVNRLVVDVERFEDDSKEIMAQRGMGVVYEVRHNLQPLRRHLTEQEKEALLDRWYRPHHQKLSDAVDKALEKYGQALIIDLHSFPSKPLPYEDDQELDRPELCIGTDATHTPDWLLNAFVERFSEMFTVNVNRPFAGAIVPMKHYQKDLRVMSIMVEVRRDLYENEETAAIREDFGVLSRHLQKGLRSAIQGE